MNEINKYPVGKFERPEKFDKESIQPPINALDAFPDMLDGVVKNLSSAQLATKTLPGVWSIAQVVNHIADSHMNGFIRVKLALTEDNPTIKPYKDNPWSNVVDGADTNLEPSLNIIRGVHKRMVLILRSLDNDGLKRTYYHPETKITYFLGQTVALYAWHGRHHLAFINELIKEKHW
jgi:hypothetical protein